MHIALREETTNDSRVATQLLTFNLQVALHDLQDMLGIFYRPKIVCCSNTLMGVDLPVKLLLLRSIFCSLCNTPYDAGIVPAQATHLHKGHKILLNIE